MAYDVAALSATTTNSRSVDLQYAVIGSLPPGSEISVEIYRSSDASYDPLEDSLVGVGLLTVITPGTHEASIETTGIGLQLAAQLPYVLTVVDPVSNGAPAGELSEDDETNNVAQFRKYSLAVIVHGLTFLSSPPDWVPLLADTLQDLNYDASLEVDWTTQSREGRGDSPQAFAVELWPQVLSAVSELNAGPDDRIDLHWIGHSRGSVVVSEVLAQQEQDPAVPESIAGNWQKVTLLDAHPSKNRTPELMSVNQRNPLGLLLGQATRLFQEIADDPDLNLARDQIDETENYFQTNEWYALSPSEVFFDWLTNYWGETDIAGVSPNHTYDVTRPRLSHFEVPNYYIDEVLLPQLSAGQPTVTGKPQLDAGRATFKKGRG